MTVDGFHVTTEVVVGFLFHRLYVRDEIPALPATIEAIVDGEVSALRTYLGDPWRLALESADPFAEAMHTAVECAEEIPFTSPLAYESASEGVRRELVDFFDPALVRSTCEEWGLPAPDPIENEPVVSDIPTLLLAGRFDPVTPAGWARQAARHLDDGQVVVFAGSGHGVLPGSACAASLVERFLEQPLHTVDETCALAEDVDFE
jgi:pimeloyl-ACP methyl ester carboxylesterase